MKKIICISIFVLIVPTLCFGKDLIIATFNCEFLTRPKVHVKFGLPFDIEKAQPHEIEQWQSLEYRDQKFNQAAKAVAIIIKKVNADVIALTEVGNENDVGELNKEVKALGLNYSYMAVGDSKDKVTNQHVAVLSKYKLMDILNHIPGRESYLKEPDDPETEEDTGVSKGIRVNFLVGNKKFTLYVAHLSSERGGHDKDQKRIAQASIIRRHYLPDIKKGRRVLVAGDLNDKKGQPTLHRIRGLDDIHEDLIQTGFAKYFDKKELGSRWTYEYMGVKQQIDHILLSYSIKMACKRSGIKAQTISHINTLASDHRPLVITLKLKK